MEDKVCPLAYRKEGWFGSCERVKCSWWDGKQCAILTLAKCIKVSVAK